MKIGDAVVVLEGYGLKGSFIGRKSTIISRRSACDVGNGWVLKLAPTMVFRESELDLISHRFKIGDKVRVSTNIASDRQHFAGRILTIERKAITAFYHNDGWILKEDTCSNKWVFTDDELELIGNISTISHDIPISIYDYLKNRINKIDENSSLKYVDDILEELYPSNKPCYFLKIPAWKIKNSDCIEICQNGSIVKVFRFKNQCEKLHALKLALLWLLEHSGIRNSSTTKDRIIKLKSKLKNLQYNQKAISQDYIEKTDDMQEERIQIEEELYELEK